MESASMGSPLRLGSTATPRNTTAETITIIEIKADQSCQRHAKSKQGHIPKLDDLDNLTISRCKLKGNDTAIVQRNMTNFRSTRRRSTACSARAGIKYAMTWGIVSPVRVCVS
jgi:hypothetical protein